MTYKDGYCVYVVVICVIVCGLIVDDRFVCLIFILLLEIKVVGPIEWLKKSLKIPKE